MDNAYIKSFDIDSQIDLLADISVSYRQWIEIGVQ